MHHVSFHGTLSLTEFTGIVSAPLWDSTKRKFAGMLTATDFINLIQFYYSHSSYTAAIHEMDQFQISQLRGIVNEHEKEISCWVFQVTKYLCWPYSLKQTKNLRCREGNRGSTARIVLVTSAAVALRRLPIACRVKSTSVTFGGCGLWNGRGDDCISVDTVPDSQVHCHERKATLKVFFFTPHSLKRDPIFFMLLTTACLFVHHCIGWRLVSGWENTPSAAFRAQDRDLHGPCCRGSLHTGDDCDRYVREAEDILCAHCRWWWCGFERLWDCRRDGNVSTFSYEVFAKKDDQDWQGTFFTSHFFFRCNIDAGQSRSV